LGVDIKTEWTENLFQNIKNKIKTRLGLFFQVARARLGSEPRSQSYEFRIYDHNASVVVGRVARFFQV
jgi:hypothetical protein